MSRDLVAKRRPRRVSGIQNRNSSVLDLINLDLLASGNEGFRYRCMIILRKSLHQVRTGTVLLNSLITVVAKWVEATEREVLSSSIAVKYVRGSSDALFNRSSIYGVPDTWYKITVVCKVYLCKVYLVPVTANLLSDVATTHNSSSALARRRTHFS